MSTITLDPQINVLAQDTTEYLRILTGRPGQDFKCPTAVAKTQAVVFNEQVRGIVAQMDDNICLVGYLNTAEELLNIRSFMNRGGLQSLAESIIGNGLAAGSEYIVVLRNRKSGGPLPKSNDRLLIKYLLAGLNILRTPLLDYIINAEEKLFSAKEAGILKYKG